MNAKQTAFLANHAAALPAAVTAPGLSAMIEALPRGRAVKALETWQEYATIFDAEEAAREALARMTAAPAPDGRKTLDELEEEAAAALAEERAKRKTLDELEEEARQAPAPRPMAERAGLGDAIRRGMAPDVTPAPFFGYPLAPTRATHAPLWPVQPRRAFADLARVMGGR